MKHAISCILILAALPIQASSQSIASTTLTLPVQTSSLTILTTTLNYYYSCVDGGGGINSTVKSSVFTNRTSSKFDYEKLESISYNFTGELWDECLGDDRVVEYYCVGKEDRFHILNCTYGCEDGRCLEKQTTTQEEATTKLNQTSEKPQNPFEALKKLMKKIIEKMRKLID